MGYVAQAAYTHTNRESIAAGILHQATTTGSDSFQQNEVNPCSLKLLSARSRNAWAKANTLGTISPLRARAWGSLRKGLSSVATFSISEYTSGRLSRSQRKSSDTGACEGVASTAANKGLSALASRRQRSRKALEAGVPGNQPSWAANCAPASRNT